MKKLTGKIEEVLQQSMCSIAHHVCLRYESDSYDMVYIRSYVIQPSL